MIMACLFHLNLNESIKLVFDVVLRTLYSREVTKVNTLIFRDNVWNLRLAMPLSTKF